MWSVQGSKNERGWLIWRANTSQALEICQRYSFIRSLFVDSLVAMNPNNSPFRAAWWSVELPGYRACDSTYCYFPYEMLPPLDESLFRGEFQWLAPPGDEMQATMAIYRNEAANARMAGNLNRLKASAAQLGLRLPAAFLAFMTSPELQDRIPSCTACYFDLSERIIQLPIDDGGYLIRFLNDQQGVLLWYLYLTPQSESAVVISPVVFDDDGWDKTPTETIRADIEFCAPTFEEFMYRFWVENTIWFASEGGHSLTEAQANYLRHYRI